MRLTSIFDRIANAASLRAFSRLLLPMLALFAAVLLLPDGGDAEASGI